MKQLTTLLKQDLEDVGEITYYKIGNKNGLTITIKSVEQQTTTGGRMTNQQLLDAMQVMVNNLATDFNRKFDEFKEEIRTEMREFKEEIRAEIRDFKAEVRQEMAEFKVEMRQEIAEFKAEVRGEIAKINKRLDVLETDMTYVKGVLARNNLK